MPTLKMNLQLFAKKEETPPEPPTPTPPTPSPKEETPSWGKQLIDSITNLGDRLTKLETEKETEKPTVTIPIPPKPKPPAQEETPPVEPAPKTKSLLDWLW